MYSESKMQDGKCSWKGCMAHQCDINVWQLDGITCYGALAVEMALLSVARHQCVGLG